MKKILIFIALFMCNFLQLSIMAQSLELPNKIGDRFIRDNDESVIYMEKIFLNKKFNSNSIIVGNIYGKYSLVISLNKDKDSLLYVDEGAYIDSVYVKQIDSIYFIITFDRYDEFCGHHEACRIYSYEGNTIYNCFEHYIKETYYGEDDNGVCIPFNSYEKTFSIIKKHDDIVIVLNNVDNVEDRELYIYKYNEHKFR